MSLASVTSLHTVTHQQLVKTIGTSGGMSTAPLTVATGKRCTVNPLSGQERIQLDKEGITATHKIYYNYDPGLGSGYVVLFQGLSLYVRYDKNVQYQNRLWVVHVEQIDQAPQL